MAAEAPAKRARRGGDASDEEGGSSSSGGLLLSAEEWLQFAAADPSGAYAGAVECLTGLAFGPCDPAVTAGELIAAERAARGAAVAAVAADARVRGQHALRPLHRELLRAPYTPELVTDTAPDALQGALPCSAGAAELLLRACRALSAAEAPVLSARAAARRWPPTRAVALAAARIGAAHRHVVVLGGGGAPAAAAACAGRQVTLAEPSPPLRGAAAEVAAANGVADRVALVAGAEALRDLPPATVVVADCWEPDGLLGGGALLRVRDALRALPPGVSVVPRRLRVSAAAGDVGLRRAAGLDLQPVAARAHLGPYPRESAAGTPCAPQPTLVSSWEPLFDITLGDLAFLPETEERLVTLRMLPQSSAVVNCCVLRWELQGDTGDPNAAIATCECVQPLGECAAPPGTLQLLARRTLGRVWVDAAGAFAAAPPLAPPFGRGALGWFADMLRDSERNGRYDAALRRALAEQRQALPPGSPLRVVDAGCGSGLLSLMALRAGADEVLGIERQPALALLAEACSRLPGNAAQWARQGACFRAAVGEVTRTQLPDEERAHVVVAELMDSGGLGEDIVPILAHARAHLLRPGGLAIPNRILIFGALCTLRLPQLPLPGGSCRSAITLAPFEAFWLAPEGLGEPAAATAEFGAAGAGGLPAHRGAGDCELLTGPAELLSIPLAEPGALAAALAPRPVRFPVRRTGTAHCLVWWFRAELGGGEVLSNAPPLPGAGAPPCTHWGQSVQRLGRPLLLREGAEAVHIAAGTDDGAGLRLVYTAGAEELAEPRPGAAQRLQEEARRGAGAAAGELMRCASASPEQLAALQQSALQIAAHPAHYGVAPRAAATVLRHLWHCAAQWQPPPPPAAAAVRP